MITDKANCQKKIIADHANGTRKSIDVFRVLPRVSALISVPAVEVFSVKSSKVAINNQKAATPS